MTDKQLAELESKELAEIAAYMDFATEQATAWRMEQAMRAVEFVSQIKYPHSATYQLRQQRSK